MLISDKLLISLGFKRQRIWDKSQMNFTLKYSIDGFDGQIDLIAQFGAPNALSPEEQVESASDLDYLIKNTGDWGYHVYGGDFHIVTIDFESELFMLIDCLKINVNTN